MLALGHAGCGAEGREIAPTRGHAGGAGVGALGGAGEDQRDTTKADDGEAGAEQCVPAAAGDGDDEGGEQGPPVGKHVGRHDGRVGEGQVLQEDGPCQADHAEEPGHRPPRVGAGLRVPGFGLRGRGPGAVHRADGQQRGGGRTVLHDQQPPEAHPGQREVRGVGVGRPQDHPPDAHFVSRRPGDLGPAGVCASLIAEKAGISAPTASRHLDVLRRAGLIETERIAGWSFHRRSPAGLDLAHRLLDDI